MMVTTVMLHWLLLSLMVSICFAAKEQKDKEKSKKTEKTESLSRGWGKDLKWSKNYTAALGKAVKNRKPLMVIHHLDSCPHSQALKEAFAGDKTIQKLAKENFVMLNVVEETGDPNLAPDGYYVPKIIFVDPFKTVRADIIGRYKDRKYAYGAKDLQLLAANMKEVMSLKHIEL